MGLTSDAISGAITEVLRRLGEGEQQAWSSLLPLVYSYLRRLAGAYVREHGPGGVLQPTAVVNETYLRLLRQKTVQWNSRAHFFGVAALLMRRILVDQARRRKIETRIMDQAAPERNSPGLSVDLCLLDMALTRLHELDPRQANVVELRYFGGLTVDETAEFLAVSPKTVKRDWEIARVWLRAELRGRGA